MSTLQTNPATIEFGGQEQWAVGIDCTNALAGYPAGTTPTSPNVTLVNVDSNVPVTLGTSPTVTGNVVAQQIAKTLLTAGHNYRLTLTFTPSGTTDTLETILTVTVPPGT